ncbi:hypothetical protein OF83DRAFT_1054702 [Amylostereum chailletii]|nr:hypothetical protein OF83DRAFT_1054702 [Amylostereum chailletii]
MLYGKYQQTPCSTLWPDRDSSKGVEVFTFTGSMWFFLRRPTDRHRTELVYCVVGSLMTAFITIQTFADFVFLEFMWIDHRDFPGGPLAYLAANSSVWWQTLGTASGQATNILGDGLLLYRCFIIWGSDWRIVAFPFLLYLGSIAMGLVTVVQSALPGSDFFKGKTVNFDVPWTALSVALNIVVTCLITYRILRARRALRETLSPESLRVFTGVIAILIESALPFSVLGIVFTVTYGKNLDGGPAFSFIWGTLCALSPQLIIFRVATGQAWTRDLVSQTAGGTMVFAANLAAEKTSESQSAPDVGSDTEVSGSRSYLKLPMKGTPSVVAV